MYLIIDPSTKYILFGLCIAGAFLFFHLYIAPAMARNEMKQEYQNAGEPTIMHQVGENDNEFWARVKRERARYEDSGNNWTLRQNPVIPFPFNRVFTIEWFGKKHNLSTVGMGKFEYFTAANRTYNELNAIWQRETNIFGEDVVNAANGQKPWDGNTWGDPGFQKKSNQINGN